MEKNKKAQAITQISVSLFSLVFGIYLNINAFICSYNSMHNLNILGLLSVFFILMVVWYILQDRSELKGINIILLGIGFVSSLTVFRKKQLILQFILGNRYDTMFSAFQDRNPIYYAGGIYLLYIAVFTVLSAFSAVSGAIRPQEITTESTYKLGFKYLNGIRNVTKIHIPENVTYFVLGEAAVKEGCLSVEISNINGNTVYVSKDLSKDNNFSVKLNEGDYLIQIISNRCRGEIFIEWNVMQDTLKR